MFSRSRKLMFLSILAFLVLAALPACSAQTSYADLHMLPLDQMPAMVQSAPASVQEGYQFSAANPDIMQQIPCYCGCGGIGHNSNYSCYVADVDAQGRIDYDTHALGCSICVDITQDTMRLLKQGKTVPEIRAYVDDTYGKYGTSNMP